MYSLAALASACPSPTPPYLRHPPPSPLNLDSSWASSSHVLLVPLSSRLKCCCRRHANALVSLARHASRVTHGLASQDAVRDNVLLDMHLTVHRSIQFDPLSYFPFSSFHPRPPAPLASFPSFTLAFCHQTCLSGPLLRMAYLSTLRCIKLKWTLLLELVVYLVTFKLMNHL